MDQETVAKLVFDIFSKKSKVAEKFDSSQAYKRFLLRKRAASGKNPVRERRAAAKIFYAAAGFCLVCMISGIAYGLLKRPASETGVIACQTIDVPEGSRVQILLPDSTVVWLNGGSSLSYGSDFCRDGRRITFSGEGFFDVHKDPESAFEIHSGETSVKVLGTKFNFRNYTDEDEASLALLEGKVGFSVTADNGNTAASVILSPDQIIKFDKTRRNYRIEDTDASYSDEWIDGGFYFHGETLGHIVSTLNHYFGTDISIMDESYRSRCFYGYYSAKNGVCDILEKLSTGSFGYTDYGNGHIIIRQN